MLTSIIEYFSQRHLIGNLIFLAVLVGGFASWHFTQKEEMPAFTYDTVRVNVRYPGAPAEDVEYYVTRPIEEILLGIDGVFRISSSSSLNQSNINVELERNYPDINEAIMEIRAAVLDVDLPLEVLDDPEIRVFKTTKKAILDLALIHQDARILGVKQRQELQRYAFTLENQLVSLPQIHSVEKRGYLQEEIQIKVFPDRLQRYDIPLNSVMDQIQQNHIRKPAGSLETLMEPKVTLLSELNTPSRLRDLIVQGGFEGRAIRLQEIAEVEPGYEKGDSIFKVNGHEAVILNVVKNSSAGILEALDAVQKLTTKFEENILKDTEINLAALDDESIDVRNRLGIISINGVIGFFLILFTLLIFLHGSAGLWVAVGIPFTLCFTMIAGAWLGYTINGTTLAAVIIVMGIVVDDAIIVAENIARERQRGASLKVATVQGTRQVLLPIVASILTTCVAFVPLFFFHGRFGSFIEYIPPIIFLMLGASLLESIFILPGHLMLRFPWAREMERTRAHWFDRVERLFADVLLRLLKVRYLILAFFIVCLGWAIHLVTNTMDFVMFPNEETRDIVLSGETDPGSTRYLTAKKLEEIEDLVAPYLGKEVVGFRSEVARSRRGGAVEENSFRMILEVVPGEKRDKSADQIINELTEKFSKLNGFSKLHFRKSRWGQESESPIEIVIQQNNDAERSKVAHALASELRALNEISYVEVDEGYRTPEYRIALNREKLKRLSIDSADVVSTFRAALEGVVLYEFSNGEENINVRLTSVDQAKTKIEEVLALPVENRNNYLVQLKTIVDVNRVISPTSINRRDLKRITTVYADLPKDRRTSPLEIASQIEQDIFPNLMRAPPSTSFSFTGEVQDTRESGSDFENATLIAVGLIFIVLAILFNSLSKPLIIMLSIPFGVMGAVFAFYLHGKVSYGFYACVGALGLAGVVINDAIVLLVKLQANVGKNAEYKQFLSEIALTTSTRLRAVLLTTLTTVAGVLPTAYGLGGYDPTLSEMMLTLAWGLIFGAAVTLVLIPCLYSFSRLRFESTVALLPIVLCLSCAYPDTPASAQDHKKLSIEQFLASASNNDSVFEEILIDQSILKFQKELKLPPRDLILRIKQEHHLDLERDTDFPVSELSLAKLFPLSGSKISLSYLKQEDSFSSNSEAQLNLSVAQPIAENAFGHSNRLLDKIIGIEVDVASYQITEAYEDYFALLSTAYINWWAAYENLIIGESSYAQNLKLLDNIRERSLSQIALPIDVNKIKIQVLAKQEK
ncbi:MAG: efflux RND transporter permease subunit, partial [Bdellovibrionales bacterium]|nr:efflux RND transporter permease subunit [Bdellovibrionales bacterium]